MAEHPLLSPVKPEKRFYLPDGTSISSMRELARRLPQLSGATFSHHVTPTKNDFHMWISAVIRDTHLSKEIKEVKDQRVMGKLISKRVAELEARDARQEITAAISTHQSKPWQSRQPTPPRLPTSPTTFPGRSPTPNQWLSQPKPQGPPSPAPQPSTPPFSERGLKPLTTKKRYRPFSPAVRLPPSQPTQPPQPGIQQTTQRISSPPKDERQEGPSGIPTPLGATLGPIEDQGIPSLETEESEAQDYLEVPVPPTAYSSKPTSTSLWPGSSQCDHKSHFSCMRCGMLEFGIGLTIGILTTLMFSKAFL